MRCSASRGRGSICTHPPKKNYTFIGNGIVRILFLSYLAKEVPNIF